MFVPLPRTVSRSATNSINDKKFDNKLEHANKRDLENAAQEAISRLDSSQDASKEEELERIANYITGGCGPALVVPLAFSNPVTSLLASRNE